MERYRRPVGSAAIERTKSIPAKRSSSDPIQPPSFIEHSHDEDSEKVMEICSITKQLTGNWPLRCFPKARELPRQFPALHHQGETISGNGERKVRAHVTHTLSSKLLLSDLSTQFRRHFKSISKAHRQHPTHSNLSSSSQLSLLQKWNSPYSGSEAQNSQEYRVDRVNEAVHFYRSLNQGLYFANCRHDRLKIWSASTTATWRYVPILTSCSSAALKQPTIFPH
jgi:hypothetical protein